MDSNDESRQRAQRILFPSSPLWTDLLALLVFLGLFAAGLAVQIRYVLALRDLPDSFLAMLGHGSAAKGKSILASILGVPVIGALISILLARLIWPKWPDIVALGGRVVPGWLGLLAMLLIQIWIGGPWWPNLAYAIALVVLVGIVEGLRVWRIFGGRSPEDSSPANPYTGNDRTNGRSPQTPRRRSIEEKPPMTQVAKSLVSFTGSIMTWPQRILLPLLLSITLHLISLPLVLLYLTRHVTRYPEIQPKPNLLFDYPTETMILILLLYGLLLFGLLVHLVLIGGKKALVPEKEIGSIWMVSAKSVGTAALYALLFSAIGIWRTAGPVIVLLVTWIAAVSPQFRQLAYAVLFNRDCSPITSPAGYRRNLLTYLPHCFTIITAGIAAILAGLVQVFFLRNIAGLTDAVLLEVGPVLLLHTWMCMLVPWIPEIATAAMIGGAAAELHTFVHNRFPWYAQSDLGQQPTMTF